MAVLRTAYVKVRPKTDGFDAELTKRLRRVDASQAGKKVGESFAKGFSDRGGALAKVASITAARMTLMGSAAAAAAPGVLQLTAALAPAAGAAVALPAALLAIKAASGTVKLAVMGVGNAIQEGFGDNAEAAKESLAKLPPEARKFATAVIGMRGQLKGLQAEVSNRFFRPFNDDVAGLARQYLPMLKTQLADMAGPLGGLAEEFAKAARQGTLFGGLKATLTGTRQGIIGAREAVTPLTNALGSLLKVGGPLVRQLGDGFGSVGARLGNFIVQAEKTGQLKQWLQGGLDTLRTLGGIASNVGGIFRTVFAAATAGSSSLLVNLQLVTGQARAFLDSAQGGSALTSLFGTLSTLGGSLRTALGGVLPALAQSVQALAPAVGGLAPVFADLVVAVAPLLPYLTQIAATVLTAAVPAVAALAGWLQNNQGVMQAVAITLGGLLLAVKAYAIYTKAAAIATTVWSVATKAAAAASKIWTGIQWLLNAALLANPIGLVVLAIGALVAAVVIAYKNSETFRNIVQAAWKGIQVAVSFAWNNVIKPAVAALVWYFRNVMAPTFLWLYNNVVKPVWAGIQLAVKAAWVVIQIILAGMKMYFERVIAPVFRFLWNNVVKPVFSGIAATISAVWNKGIKPIFEVLGGFIRDKVAPAFRSGVSAIASAWNKVKDAASKPVRFVIDQVLNQGIIGGINWLASKVGVKDRIPPIKWGGGGGGSKTGDAISGNTKYGDGYGHRHGTGDGEGIGDGLGSLLTNPGKWLGNRMGIGKLAARFGNNPFVKMLTGAMGRAKNFALEKVQSLVGEFLGRGGGGSVGAGGLRSGISGALASLRATFGNVPLISGVRPGATTLTGNRSYHADGRAIDIAPVRAWAEYLNRTYRPQLRELITPWQDLNLLNGRPHQYRGAVWQQHNFAGGNAHVHAAMANGGIIHEPVFGIGRSGRTYAFGERGPETVTPGVAGAASAPVHFHFHGPVASKQAAQDMVLTAYQQLKRERKIP
ncbi:hypothetical protein [Micromonospora peucetia]|uniref:Phage-related protein n=1 Tax=Micromonospora peucetia TaxID=47871 RepID=A0ABZ1EJZ8_9ACTN|nr:hypothetical protein [Micromonospora peucetia]WSA34554.1 hypothetical protein OIE14_11170 [Micromonospora peucetia]